MLNLSYWNQQNNGPIHFDNILGSIKDKIYKKYNKDNTLETLIELINQHEDVSSVSLVLGRSMGLNILVATKDNEMYNISTYRPVLSDHKNINDWMFAFYSQKICVCQINNRVVWL